SEGRPAFPARAEARADPHAARRGRGPVHRRARGGHQGEPQRGAGQGARAARQGARRHPGRDQGGEEGHDHRARLDRERDAACGRREARGPADRGRGLLPRAAPHLARRQTGPGRPEKSAPRHLKSMFIGHFAVAFAAKPAAPSVSLGTLFFACEWVDLVWPLFLLIGLERVEIRPGITAFTPLDFLYYPWTHSLLMGVFWAVAFGLLYLSVRKSGKSALLVGIVVLSHWFLDLVAHRPDLPLAPGGEARWGLGLWNSIPATLLVKVSLFVAGVALYVWRTRAMDRVGRWGLWVLLV